ncbi:hypothetical protein ES702_02609 [subsurface metagenome]
MRANKNLLVIPIIVMFIVGMMLVISLSGDVDEFETPVLHTIYPNPDTDRYIYLLWNITGSAISSDIYRSKDGEDYIYIASHFGFRRSSMPLLQTYEDTVLFSGNYSYKIKAVYETGESDFSNIESVTVILD